MGLEAAGAAAPQTSAPASGGAAPTGAEPTPVTTQEAPVAAPAAATVAAPETPAPETAADIYEMPDATAFDWDGWDGKGHDKFDENLRPWVEAASKRHSALSATALQDEAAKTARWQRMYTESMTHDLENSPQMKELSAARDAATAASTKLKGENERLTRELADHQRSLQDFARRQSDNYVAWFQRQYPELVQDDAKLNVVMDAAEHLDLEWDEVAEMAKLGDDALKLAKAAKDNGVPSKMLAQWVQTHLAAAAKGPAAKVAREVNASAELTSEREDVSVAPSGGWKGGGKGKGGLSDESILAAVRAASKGRTSPRP